MGKSMFGKTKEAPRVIAPDQKGTGADGEVIEFGYNKASDRYDLTVDGKFVFSHISSEVVERVADKRYYDVDWE